MAKYPFLLPNSGSRNLDAYRVSDKNNPNSILSDKKTIFKPKVIVQIMEDIINYIYTYRFIQENPGKFKKQSNLNIGMEVTLLHCKS